MYIYLLIFIINYLLIYEDFFKKLKQYFIYEIINKLDKENLVAEFATEI